MAQSLWPLYIPPLVYAPASLMHWPSVNVFSLTVCCKHSCWAPGTLNIFSIYLREHGVWEGFSIYMTMSLFFSFHSFSNVYVNDTELLRRIIWGTRVDNFGGKSSWAFIALSASVVGYFCRLFFHVGNEGRCSRPGVHFNGTLVGVCWNWHIWGLMSITGFSGFSVNEYMRRFSCHLWTVPAHHLKSKFSAATFHSNLEEIHT
jgi:hypothetical protein